MDRLGATVIANVTSDSSCRCSFAQRCSVGFRGFGCATGVFGPSESLMEERGPAAAGSCPSAPDSATM